MTRPFASAAGALLVALGAALPVAAQTAAEAAPADPAAVVATVNGQPITLGDVIAIRQQLPPQVQQLPDEFLYDGIRTQLVDTKLVEIAAEAAGLADDPAVARAIARQRSGVLADAYIRRAIEAGVTDETLQARYQRDYAGAEPVREVRASHILVADEALAKELRAQLDGGADFAALAAEHGTDGTKTRGGDLGFFSREVMVPEFAEAAFATPVGQTAGPIQTQFGWHVLRVTEERNRPVPAFEEVRAEIEEALSREVAEGVLENLRNAATVSLDEARPGLGALRDDSLID